MSHAITLTPAQTTLAELHQVFEGAPAMLHRSFKPAVERSAAIIAAAAAGDAAIYGVNTGFGKLASVRIPAEDTATLQRNLILSHCAGVGEPLSVPVTRLVMALKLVSLGRGASGVRFEIIELLEAMLAKGVIPIIPAQGSVGASGDLAPLAHMSAVMMGEGFARYGTREMSGAEALHSAGLKPIAFGAKEGLALINGTQVSTALCLAGLFAAWRCMQSALITGALATDAAMGSSAPFHHEIHTLRGHAGQIDAADALRILMDGSVIRTSHIEGDERVQDPYCIRCQPQVMGACIDALRHCAELLQTEANAVTDNPLILSDGQIVSGGNFHAEPVALAADYMAIAMAEIGSVTQRRIAMLVDPAVNFGLPAFLSPAPGLNSGYMIAEVTSAALMSENRQKAAPASIDSTPTSANQEDHVSMACLAARRLLPMADNLAAIIGIEALLAAQGVEFRAPLVTSPVLQQVIGFIRTRIPALTVDRYLADDLQQASDMVKSGALVSVGAQSLGALQSLPCNR